MANKSKSESYANNIHKEHRKRMRDRLSVSPELLSDHEIIEMLLYYSIPRGNTNEQAHNLLYLGENLKGVLDLSPPQIKSIKGLGDATLLLFTLLREFYIRVERQKLDRRNLKKITKDNISEKLHKIFMGSREERMIMLTVDKDCRLINTHIISLGATNAVGFSIKSVVRMALDDDAHYVFLAHNHPNEVLVPTQDDLETTELICNALSLINVPVIEHYIVTSSAELGIIDRYNRIPKTNNNNH